MIEVTIYFAWNVRHEPRPGEFEKLKPIEDVLKWEGTQVDLYGHASTEGKVDYNLDLSRDRATCIKAYLEKKGGRPDRLLVHPRGEAEPKVAEKGLGAELEALRAQNRRVVVKCTVGKKPSPGAQLIARTRGRYQAASKALQSSLKRMQAALDRAVQTKNPLIVRDRMEVLSGIRLELDLVERRLKELEDVEKKYSDPDKAWAEFSKLGRKSITDIRIEGQRKLIEETRRLVEEANKQRLIATDSKMFRLWQELHQTFLEELAEQQKELEWLYKDQREEQESMMK
jgi:hypothetical protein